MKDAHESKSFYNTDCRVRRRIEERTKKRIACVNEKIYDLNEIKEIMKEI